MNAKKIAIRAICDEANRLGQIFSEEMHGQWWYGEDEPIFNKILNIVDGIDDFRTEHGFSPLNCLLQAPMSSQGTRPTNYYANKNLVKIITKLLEKGAVVNEELINYVHDRLTYAGAENIMSLIRLGYDSEIDGLSNASAFDREERGTTPAIARRMDIPVGRIISEFAYFKNTNGTAGGRRRKRKRKRKQTKTEKGKTNK